MDGAQERDVEDHDPVGVREAVLAGDHLDADGRVGDRVEVGERLGIAEHQRGERGTVDTAFAVEDLRSEPVDERLVGRATRLDHLAGDQVGVDQGRAALDQQVATVDLPVPMPPVSPTASTPVRRGQSARRGRDAVAKRTMVVRSSWSVTKKSSEVMPVAPPESPRAISR